MADLSKVKIGGSTYNIKDSTARQGIQDILDSKGRADGIASLDEQAKVPLNQLPDVILGQMMLGGTVEYESGAGATIAYPTANLQKKLNISDTTIQLVNSATDDKSASPKKYGYKTLEGVYFICRSSFDVAGVHFEVGDWLIGAGTYWDKIDNTDAVISVNGKTGVVVLNKADIGLENVDNTSDLNKPISTATQTALDNKSKVTVSASGTSATQVKYITIDGVESKLSDVDKAYVDTELAKKQNVIDGTHKLSADLVEDGTINHVFTAADDIKLAGIESGAEVNTIESIKLNGGIITPVDRVVDLGSIATTTSAISSITYTDASHTLTAADGEGTTKFTHVFGALADKSSASGTLDTVDSASFSYTPAGSVAISHTSTAVSSSGSYTPEGDVEGSVIPTGTVSVTLSNGVLNDLIDSVGTQASYSHSGFTGGSLAAATKSSFNTDGIKAHMGESGSGEDAECLYFEAAATSQAVTEQGEFTAAVYGTDTFTANTLPTKKSQTVGVSASTFTGNPSGDTIRASFTGSAKTVNVSGNYDKANASATFTGTAAAGTEVTVNKTEKTVTVE